MFEAAMIDFYAALMQFGALFSFSDSFFIVFAAHAGWLGTSKHGRFNNCGIMANRFEKYQIDALDMAFEESNHLTKRKKIELVSTTGLDMEQIASWFNRKRAHKKARESVGGLERTNAELQQALQESEEKAKLHKELQESMKRALQESEERESKLQKELQESMKREAELGVEIQHLRQKLRIIGGDLSLILY